MVIMIGRWSEANAPTTFHDVMGARFGEQKEMSGDDGRKLAWWGMCVFLWVVENVEVICLVLYGGSSVILCVFHRPGRCLGVEVTTQDEVGYYS